MDKTLTKRSDAKSLHSSAIVIAGLVIAILIVALFCIFSFVSRLLFLCQAEETIRAKLLKETPLGSSMEEVAEYIERKGWHRDITHQERLGFVKWEQGKPWVVVGSKSFEAELEITIIYQRIIVTAYWGFDEEGKLSEVWVEKLVTIAGK